MAVDSIKGVVEAAIQRASSATGVDFGFLMRAAKRESGFNPGAKAPTSSAAGLFQFVDQTWMSTLKKHGAKYGYAQYADMIQQGSDGRFHVSDAQARQAVLNLRLDPHAASLMAGELTTEHASYLRGRVGRDPTPGELYAAHFLGPQGSAKLIEAARDNPQADAAALFPDAAIANRAIFYRGGKPASVLEVYANLTNGSSGAGSAASAASTASTAAPSQGGFLQFASAGRVDRSQQEQEMVDLVLRGPDEPDGGAGSSLTNSLFSADMLRMLSDARHGRGVSS
jgi:hypothetical protein